MPKSLQIAFRCNMNKNAKQSEDWNFFKITEDILQVAVASVNTSISKEDSLQYTLKSALFLVKMGRAFYDRDVFARICIR